jgi:hypothetical protein
MVTQEWCAAAGLRALIGQTGPASTGQGDARILAELHLAAPASECISPQTAFPVSSSSVVGSGKTSSTCVLFAGLHNRGRGHPEEIAKPLGITGLHFRNWLRVQKALGHPLVAGLDHRAR